MTKDVIFAKIISPFRKEFENEILYIEVPTIEGIIGVYPNHTALITKIGEGILKISLVSNEFLEFKIKGGFFRLENNKCIISTKGLIPN